MKIPDLTEYKLDPLYKRFWVNLRICNECFGWGQLQNTGERCHKCFGTSKTRLGRILNTK